MTWGPSTYDICSVEGEGVNIKQPKVLISCGTVLVMRGRVSENPEILWTSYMDGPLAEEEQDETTNNYYKGREQWARVKRTFWLGRHI